MITFKIDQLTPCLKSTQTGEFFETEVIRIRRKSFLQKFNKRTGWHINWSEFPEGVEIYAQPLLALNNPYRFALHTEVAKKIREVYDYEWKREDL